MADSREIFIVVATFELGLQHTLGNEGMQTESILILGMKTIGVHSVSGTVVSTLCA